MSTHRAVLHGRERVEQPSSRRQQAGELSPEVQSFVSNSAERYLLEVVDHASMMSMKLSRSRLTGEDIQMAIKQLGESHLYTFFASDQSRAGEESTDEMARAGRRVDLRQIMNAPIPPAPLEPHFEMHWLAIDGKQPVLPENPSLSPDYPGDVGSDKVSMDSSHGECREGPGKGGGERGGDGASPPQLSRELTAYLRRCCRSVMVGSAEDKKRALSSLRADSGLQLLLPHFCAFIQTKVMENLRVKKDVNQLAALLEMFQCLIDNKHFAFMEIYLDRLMPCLMSCLLHRDFEPQDDQGSAPASSPLDPNGSWSSRRQFAEPSPRWSHWKIRDYAASLVCQICASHGDTYPTLHARAIQMYHMQLSKGDAEPTTLYGAMKGLMSLGALAVEQTIFPQLDALASRISKICEKAAGDRDAKRVEEAHRCRSTLLATLPGKWSQELLDSLSKFPQVAGSIVLASCTGLSRSCQDSGGVVGSRAGRGAIGDAGCTDGYAQESTRARKRRVVSLRRRLERSAYTLGGKIGQALTTSDRSAAGSCASESARGNTVETVEVRQQDTGVDEREWGVDEVVPFYLCGQGRVEIPFSQWITHQHKMCI